MRLLENILSEMNDERVFAMALTKVKGLSLHNALILYRTVGNATDIFKGLATLKDKIPQASVKMWNVLNSGADEAIRRAEKELDFCESEGIEILCLNEPKYPHRLQQCEDAPLVLYYKGTADLNAVHMVSMVGTRRCTEYGKDLCRTITADLARLCPDTVIVSGLAYGIDIHSHRGALEAGLPTVAVLAHGLDRIYPFVHRDTAKQMIGQGGLLTEYMTGTNPDKGNFVCRNRIVAGLTDACVVVESAHKGGAIITARLAFDYNRQVFACPGRIGDEYSEGCDELVRSNTASLLLNGNDIATGLNWITTQQRKEALEKPLQTELFPKLNPVEQLIVKILHSSDGLQINVISQQLDCPVHEVSGTLFELEMKGVVKLMPGGVYRLLQK